MARIAAGTTPERTSRLLFIAAVVFAGLAAVLVFVALQDRSGGGSVSAPATIDAVVATRSVAANTKLTPDMVELRALPAEAVLDDAYGDAQAVAGLATRYPLEAGEQITLQKVGSGTVEDKDDVSLVLESGQRGFGVEVSEVTSAGGLLLAGNFVDVIAVFPENVLRTDAAAGANQRLGAMTLLQDVEVIAVAQEAQQPVPAANDSGAPDASGLQGQRPSDADRQPEARSVTLAVTPEDAQLLALAQERGAVIWLSLRPAGDHEQVPLTPVELLRLLEQQPQIVP